MPNRKRPHFMAFGPAMPVVAIAKFSKGLPEGSLEQAWNVCGPSAELNMRKLQLWQVIAAAYLEGLRHGSSMSQEHAGQT